MLFRSENLIKSLKDAGYELFKLKGEEGYFTLKGKGEELIAYIYDTNTATEFYISELNPMAENTNPVAASESANELKQVQNTPAPVSSSPKEEITKPVQPVSGGFTFTTSNFDDGWSATSGDDFVSVTRENVIVRLYYAVEITEQMRPPVNEITSYFWNTIVLPSFNVSNTRKYEEGITYFSTNYMWAEAVEKSTGRKCYLGLNVVTNSGIAQPVLAIAPDKNAYEKFFPGPKDVSNMLGYNRFAVALQDVTGTWKESSGAAANYYNVYTGAYAGMGFASGSSEFKFLPSGEYSSKHTGAMGMVDNMTTYNQEYKGMAKISNWEIVLNNRFKGKTDTFNAWFEAVKGGRILKLIDRDAPGIKYFLVKVGE